jgi:hypothetical protein
MGAGQCFAVAGKEPREGFHLCSLSPRTPLRSNPFRGSMYPSFYATPTGLNRKGDGWVPTNRESLRDSVCSARGSVSTIRKFSIGASRDRLTVPFFAQRCPCLLRSFGPRVSETPLASPDRQAGFTAPVPDHAQRLCRINHCISRSSS